MTRPLPSPADTAAYSDCALAAAPGGTLRAMKCIAPAPGDAPDPHQAERPEPRHQGRAVPEQHDLGDDALGPQRSDHRVGEAELAPVERAEAVIELVARLQRGAARDEQPEAAVGGEPAERRPAYPAG